MNAIIPRVIDNLFGRIDGPMAIRLEIQPILATAFALRDGYRDAKQQRAPYALSLYLDPDHRGHRLRGGRIVFSVALVLDVI
jgi:hypothetical protein